MFETEYPASIQAMLLQAEQMLETDRLSAPDVADICFEILAIYPDHPDAAELVYRSFCSPPLIREYRKAHSRLIDEWDDRAWQHRRRLAISFSLVSRWAHKDALDDEQLPDADRTMLTEGKMQLLQHYTGGSAYACDVAWAIFQDVLSRTEDMPRVMLWIAHVYATHGYFIDAVNMLEQFCEHFPTDPVGKRYWVETRWWRDHQHQIPWIPPGREGKRFQRHLASLEPEALLNENELEQFLREHRLPNPKNLPHDFLLPEPLPEEMVWAVELAAEKNSPDFPAAIGPVDWSYLDKFPEGKLDTSQFPAWARDLLDGIDDPEMRAHFAAELFKRFSSPELHAPEQDEEE